MTEITSIPLLVGSCRQSKRLSIRDGSWRRIDFPAMPMLMVHPTEGPILFDTGYDAAYLAATDPFPERLYRWATPPILSVDGNAAAQLAKRGYDPADVRHVVLSHFHADHMAGLHAFPHAHIHCARAGYDALRAGGRISAVRHGYLRSLIPADFGHRALWFEDGRAIKLPNDFQPFEQGIDILGDGSLIAISLPGHCPGHWGLAFRDDRFGWHMLIGDAAWSCDAVRRNQPAPAITTWMLGDTATARDTLAKLHHLLARNGDIRLSPYHCPERAAELHKHHQADHQTAAP